MLIHSRRNENVYTEPFYCLLIHGLVEMDQANTPYRLSSFLLFAYIFSREENTTRISLYTIGRAA